MAHHVVQPFHERPPAGKRQKIASPSPGSTQSLKPGSDVQNTTGLVHVLGLGNPFKDGSAGLSPDGLPVACMSPAPPANLGVPPSKASIADSGPEHFFGLTQNGNSADARLHGMHPLPVAAAGNAPAGAAGPVIAEGSAHIQQADTAAPSMTIHDLPAHHAAVPAVEHSNPQHVSTGTGIGTSGAGLASNVITSELPDQAPDGGTAAVAAEAAKAVEAQEEEVATGKVERAVRAVATATGCDICGEVMRDPVTAPECMHSFCAACIDEYIFDLQVPPCSPGMLHLLLSPTVTYPPSICMASYCMAPFTCCHPCNTGHDTPQSPCGDSHPRQC